MNNQIAASAGSHASLAARVSNTADGFGAADASLSGSSSDASLSGLSLVTQLKHSLTTTERRQPKCSSCYMALDHSKVLVSPCEDTYGPRSWNTPDSFVELVHKQCQNRNPGKIFFCLNCGGNATRRNDLFNRHCKCQKVSAPEPLLDEGGDTAETPVDFGGPSNDPFSAMENDAVQTAINDLDQRTAVRTLLADENEWSSRSGNFFLREYEKEGGGLRGLVFKALINHKAEADFDGLKDAEVHHQMHVAKIHNDMHNSTSIDVCEMTRHVVKQGRTESEMELKQMRESFESSIEETLGEGMLKKINNLVDKKMENHHRQSENQRRTNHPTDWSKVRKCHTEGEHSIVSNLPVPEVENFQGLCAHIPVKNIINHMLALGLAAVTFRAGHDTDWVDGDGNYKCQSIREAHESVKKMMQDDPSLPADTLVYTLRVWSDGFEAFQVKQSNDFNSLQLFTVTLLAPKGETTKLHTWPFALGFKCQCNQAVFLQMLSEVRQLETVCWRYCGRQKKCIPTVFILDLISNDYPERCYNTGCAQMGMFTHMWGHSFKYDSTATPSCPGCELKRIEHVHDNTDSVLVEDCGQCSDWCSSNHSTQRRYDGLDSYPIQPGDSSNYGPTYPTVELSFALWKGEIDRVEKFIKESSINQATTNKRAKDHLQVIGLAPPMVKQLVEDVANGLPAQESEAYPAMVQFWKDNGTEMDKFGTMPMHMIFLGVEKSLTSKTKSLVNRRNRSQNQFWHKFTTLIQASQKSISGTSVDWLLSMSFSGKDTKTLGTANWQSDHYKSFTRLSLFHLGLLDPVDGRLEMPEEMNRVLTSFKRVRVIWFCLVSSIYADEKVSSNRLDNLVKLFLSACKDLWEVCPEQLGSEEVSGGDEEELTASTGKRKRAPRDTNEMNDCDAESSAKKSKRRPVDKASETLSGGAKQSGKSKATTGRKTKRKGKGRKSAPFFVSGSNYMSLLNVKKMVDRYESMPAIDEGRCESYIQNIKRELTSMRHTIQFLVTILRKLVSTMVFSLLNENNPHNVEEKYARTYNFKVYNPKGDLSSILANDAVFGVIDKEGRMFVCVENSRGGKISLHPTVFDDAEGYWCYNLWYSPASLGVATVCCATRKELIEMSSDFFVMLRPVGLEDTTQSSLGSNLMFTHRTVVCRSWRVRNDHGKLSLPDPQLKTLLLQEASGDI
jgi:hypothetical protein